MKYRKKPVVVEAMQYAGNREDIEAFVGHSLHRVRGTDVLLIPTLESPHEAHPGDWIIKGIKGEFYPCKPDIFAATYEPGESPPRMTETEAEAPLDGLTLEGQVSYWKDRAQRAEQKLQDLKDVAKAKALLMRDGWTEPTAHRYIQKTAMDSRTSAGELARHLIEGLLRPRRPAPVERPCCEPRANDSAASHDDTCHLMQ